MDLLKTPPPAAALGAQTVVEDDSASIPASKLLDNDYFKTIRAVYESV